MLNLVDADTDIVKAAVCKKCLILFDDMTGNAAALTDKKIEPTNLSIRHGISLTFEVITVEWRVSRNQRAFKAGNCFCDMINRYFIAADPEYGLECRRVVRIFANDFEYGLIISQAMFYGVD